MTDERFSANFTRSANREALRQIIVDSFSTLTVEEVIARLEQAQIANARVNDMQGVWDHPQLKARDSWREVDSPAGKLPSLLPPARSTAFEPRMDGVRVNAPEHAEHSSDLGFVQSPRSCGRHPFAQGRKCSTDRRRGRDRESHLAHH